MQMLLPIFPKDTRLINAHLGLREQDGTVYYLMNGLPIHCHEKSDIKSFRYITATLVVNNLCKASELADTIGVNRRNIERYAQQLRKHGTSWFFNRSDKRGTSYKMTAEVLARIQARIDRGRSNYSIAKEIGISEGSIWYHLKKGTLKKK